MNRVARLIFIASMLIAGLSFGAYGVALAAPDLRVGILGWMVSAGPARQSVHLPTKGDATDTQEASETQTMGASQTSEVTEKPEGPEVSEFEETESPEAKETTEVEESQSETENSGEEQNQGQSAGEDENSPQGAGQSEGGGGDSYLSNMSALSIHAWVMAGLALPS